MATMCRERLASVSTTSRWCRSTFAALLAAPVLALSPAASAVEDDAIGFERTPPRLSLVDGAASFWRPGGEEWTDAQVNTPLAAGDQLYTADAANLEIQVGPRSYVRVGERTQMGLFAIEPDYLQVRLTDGNLSLDLRSLKAGQTFEVDTPNAAFTVETAGYYRVTFDGQNSTFVSRRGGRAVVTPASGVSTVVGASEQVVVREAQATSVETYAAPEIDSWDRWNYARTERQIETVSARYVPSDVYGLSDLDSHGDWRQVPTYGSVWVPRHVPAAWAPYSTGRWIYDPFYGWSWVDTAVWGWAPFHYGRWVHVSGFWGWCPGPVVVRPYYAPALVAFYGGPISVGVSIGAPFGWVALGWGEPLAPWWGPVSFRRRAHWAGWGGPRVVNRVVVKNRTVINVDRINVYENARVRHGVVVVDRNDFGRRRVDSERRRRGAADELRPVRGDLPFRPTRESLSPGERSGRRPPREVLERRVVTTREPRIARVGVQDDEAGARVRNAPRADRRAAAASAPAPRVVQPTRDARKRPETVRPELARGDARVRSVPPPPPRGEDMRRSQRQRRVETAPRSRVPDPPAQAARQGTEVRQRERRRDEPRAGASATRRDDAARVRAPRESEARSPRMANRERSRDLSGESTNRVYRERRSDTSGQSANRVDRERNRNTSGGSANGLYRDRSRVTSGQSANGVYRERRSNQTAPQRMQQRDRAAAASRRAQVAPSNRGRYGSDSSGAAVRGQTRRDAGGGRREGRASR